MNARTSSSTEYGSLLDRVFDDDQVRAMIEEAERSGIFPRSLIERLGGAGVFAEKWNRGPRTDLDKLFQLSERLGGSGSAGVAAGVSLHDSAIAVLTRFGRSD